MLDKTSYSKQSVVFDVKVFLKDDSIPALVQSIADALFWLLRNVPVFEVASRKNDCNRFEQIHQ